MTGFFGCQSLESVIQRDQKGAVQARDARVFRPLEGMVHQRINTMAPRPITNALWCSTLIRG